MSALLRCLSSQTTRTCMQRAVPSLSSMLQGASFTSVPLQSPSSSPSHHSFSHASWAAAPQPLGKVPSTLTSTFNSMSLYLQAMSSNVNDDDY